MPPGLVDPARHTFRSPQLMRGLHEAVQFLDATPLHSLPPERFPGVGVYLLSYSGAFAAYASIARPTQHSSRSPIYAGKAVPPGWRTARVLPAKVPGALSRRLREHAGSIESVASLDVGDFQCRFMILDIPETDLIAAVEATLIRTYTPLWNTVVDGFGNHDPGRGRAEQTPSEWDVLHPGRPWVARLREQLPQRTGILAKIHHHPQGALDFS